MTREQEARIDRIFAVLIVVALLYIAGHVLVAVVRHTLPAHVSTTVEQPGRR